MKPLAVAAPKKVRVRKQPLEDRLLVCSEATRQRFIRLMTLRMRGRWSRLD